MKNGNGRETLVQRSISVPDEIDVMAQDMMSRDPDMSYSVAIRKILRAGREVIEREERRMAEIKAGQTQLDMDEVEARR